MDSSPTSATKKSSALSTVLEYLELFVLCLCVILLIFSFGVRVCSVSGTSMLPTLEDGQLLLVSNLFYTPTQGDIIIFHQTSELVDRYNEPMVKRIIATEGQTVYIDFTDNIVRVDGVALSEDYIQLIYDGNYHVFAEHNTSFVTAEDGTLHRIFEATVPKGHLFVMGDNRNGSADSRTAAIGFVDERRVLGRVLVRLLPTAAFGPVN